MSRYNLIDEKWIPVRFPDGRRDELGIRETMLRSQEIEAIEDPSPLVTAALHRFLLAVLYRALEGPTDSMQARILFKEGLPEKKIIEYLEKWRDRFWLFHEKYPFGQIPTFEPKTYRSWPVLAAEHNADNAKVLFDHIDVTAAGTISPSSTTRWILATQTFSVSCGKSELSHTGTAPSATAAIIMPIGNNLQDTLVLSLVPQNMDILENDLPLWERNPETVEELRNGIDRACTGFADRYTWRIRSIKVYPSVSDEIEKVAFASGVGNSSLDQIDPMVAYQSNKDKGRLPIPLRERGFWRDFDSLLPDDSTLAPRVIEHSTYLTQPSLDRYPKAVIVLGQANDKAKIDFWRMERFTLPGALACNHSIRIQIRRLLDRAEDTQKALWSSCSSFARYSLSHGDRGPDPGDIRKFVNQMPVIPQYWSALEIRFHEILGEYTLEKDFEDDIYPKWLTYVRDTLLEVWNRHRESVRMSDAWTIRALVRSEGPIFRKIKELNDEIKETELQEVNA